MSLARQTRMRSASVWAALGLAIVWSSYASASKLQMKDGRLLTGKIGEVSKLAENPLAPKGGDTKTITFLDDGLRRIFVPRFQIQQILEADSGEVKERIALAQPVAARGNQVHRLGPIISITPFDVHGRRTFTMSTDKGPLAILQGITMITPLWTKVEGLNTKETVPVVWDMRIATNSIPRETIKDILARRIAPTNLDHRLRVVRLFLQMDWLQDAQKELELVIADFPNEKQLKGEVQALRQLHARRIVDEIKLRRKSGQHPLAYSMLEQFPSDDVAGEVLEQVRELLEEYRNAAKQADQMKQELAAAVASIEETARRKQCADLLTEINEELSINTFARMAPYLQLRDDPTMAGEQKLALAFSGWLLGPNQANTNLSMALSLVKVRGVVQRYLTEPLKANRQGLLEQLKGFEGASNVLVEQLIANMKPPLETPAPSVAQPGFYRLQVPVGIDGEADATYFVQLPLGYDPHLRYPTIVTLNGVATTPEKQIDWWAGAADESGNRLGQATRHGYIVLAVEWLKAGQQEYEYSAREHAAVLTSLRDVQRRFSIDTDRVFLTGHSMGGNAVWDIGLAHPDLWAGVLPIVGVADRYCARYWKNARMVPFYVLGGEMDGDKTIKNAETLDRYMLNRYDLTVTEYQGRGHEDFYEDILNMLDWMGRREKRQFFPKEFTTSTMRSWDNFFWWVEAGRFPERAVVEPTNWPPAANVRPLEITAKIQANNTLSISSANIDATVWLSPEMVDFSKPIQIKLNGRLLNAGGRRIEPDLEVLLEDVRTRGDRQHPFWAKVN